MSVVIGIIIGLLTGVGASMLFWWWQTKLLQPRVEICPTLARYELPDGTRLVEVKLVNRRRRPAADLVVTVRLSVPELVSGANQIFKLRDENVAWLNPGEDWYFSLRPSHLPDNARQQLESHLPEEKVTMLKGESDAEIDMWEILSACTGAAIKAYVAASDSFSGARAFSMRVFQQSDFRAGAFLEGRECSHTGRYKDKLTHEEESASQPV